MRQKTRKKVLCGRKQDIGWRDAGRCPFPCLEIGEEVVPDVFGQ